MAAPAEQSIVIWPAARALRRELGLTAWVALEELLLDARPDESDRIGVHTNARALAVRLAVSKDTAAAALRRLTAAGLARRESNRDPSRGVFDRSVYVLDIGRAEREGITPRAAGAPARIRRRVIEPVGTQGALFEPEVAGP